MMFSTIASHCKSTYNQVKLLHLTINLITLLWEATCIKEFGAQYAMNSMLSSAIYTYRITYQKPADHILPLLITFKGR